MSGWMRGWRAWAWGFVAWMLFWVLTFLSLFVSLGSLSEPYPDFAHGALETFVSMWAVVLVTAAIPLLPLLLVKSRAGRTVWVLSCGVLVLLNLGSGIVASSTLISTWGYREQVRSETPHFASVCSDGSPIADAIAYSGGKATMIVLDAGGNPGYWTGEAIQRSWSSAGMSNVQLVACLGEEQSTRSTCDYSGGGAFTMYKWSRKAWIVEARTGKILDEKSFAGTDPDRCPGWLPDHGPFESSGSQVSWDDSRIWDFFSGWQSGGSMSRTLAPQSALLRPRDVPSTMESAAQPAWPAG